MGDPIRKAKPMNLQQLSRRAQAYASVLCLLLATACLPPAPAPATVGPSRVPSPAPSVTPTTSVALLPVPADTALARRFDVARAMEDVRVLASPEYSGRRAGTAGSDAAGRWIAGQFAAAGALPGGEGGSYYQRFSIPFLDLAEMPALQLIDGQGAVLRSFASQQDFREVIADSAGGGRAEAQVVYVGAGASRDLQLLDLSGKIALTTSPEALQVASAVAAKGAAALLYRVADSSRLTHRGSYLVPVRPNAIPCLAVGDVVVNALLGAGGETTTDLTSLSPGPMSARVRASVVLQPIEERPVDNVLAILPGADPAHVSEVVIVGAHHDHVGTYPNGIMFPGANDDASGVASLLEIARVLSESGFRPARTILFAAWTAEEAGLLGASHYVDSPRYPLTSTAAMLQLDVTGQGRGATLNVTRGSGSLSATIHAAAAELGVPTSTEQAEGGSDHVPFVQAGVPASLLIWSDVMSSIHTAGDTAESLDAGKLRAAGQVALLTVLRLASGD